MYVYLMLNGIMWWISEYEYKKNTISCISLWALFWLIRFYFGFDFLESCNWISRCRSNNYGNYYFQYIVNVMKKIPCYQLNISILSLWKIKAIRSSKFRQKEFVRLAYHVIGSLENCIPQAYFVRAQWSVGLFFEFVIENTLKIISAYLFEH